MKQITKLTEANYKEIFELSQFAFQYTLSKEELIKKKNDLKDHTVFAWMEDDQLAGKVHTIPLSVYINGKEFQMGGIASVATWPEYRRRGIIKNLLHRSLIEMKKNGQFISFLSPFSFSFYRKYGWEYAFTNKHYEIPIELLRRKWDGKGYVRRIHQDIPKLHNIYTTYAKQYTGMLKRNQMWWENRVLKDDMLIAVAYNEKAQEEGYIIFKVQNRVLTVKEMVYTTLNGRDLLFEFIANHDSMAKVAKLTVPENDSLPLLLNEPRFDQRIIPYFMARIVDVYNFLKNYPYLVNDQPVQLSLHITDDFFPENSGIYQLMLDNREVNISYEKKAEVSNLIHCSIQQLTSLLLGFQRPVDLHSLGFIQGDVEEIKKLEQIIPKQQTFLSDFF